ncbi:hypothetical protein KAZ82_01715 [Candidatus Babeliales bacterium]|nr:hypothetical protein [Candidatus Babeliales bacterium]
MKKNYFSISLFLISWQLLYSAEKNNLNIQKTSAQTKSHDLLIELQTELSGFVQEDYPNFHAQNFLTFIKSLATTYPSFKQAIDNGTIPPTAPQTGTIGSPDPILERAWIDSKSPYAQEGFRNYTERSLNDLHVKFLSEFTQLAKVLYDVRENIYKLSEQDLKELQKNPNFDFILNRLKEYKQTLLDTLPKLDAAYANNTTPASAPQTILAGQTATQMNATENLILYSNAHKEFIEKLKIEIDRNINENIHNIESIKNRINRALQTKKS